MPPWPFLSLLVSSALTSSSTGLLNQVISVSTKARMGTYVSHVTHLALYEPEMIALWHPGQMKGWVILKPMRWTGINNYVGGSQKVVRRVLEG